MPRRARLGLAVTYTFSFTIAALAATACSTLIGLEDRKLRADGGSGGGEGGSGGGEGGAGDGGGIDGGGGDAGADGSTLPDKSPCETAGSSVLEFRAGDESWRYDISPAPTNDGFTFTGIAFHLVRSTEMQHAQAKRQLYMRREKGIVLGDHFATVAMNELGPAYETVATMFAVYEITPQPPGTVEVKVIVREAAPVRHKLLVGENALVPLGWKLDNRAFYACP